MNHVTMAQKNNETNYPNVCLTRFPFGLGCSGVGNGSFVSGVLLMEKTHDTKSQILDSDLQTLHVYICNTHGKCACDGLRGCTVLMPLFVVDRVSLVTFNT